MKKCVHDGLHILAQGYNLIENGKELIKQGLDMIDKGTTIIALNGNDVQAITKKNKKKGV